MNRVLDVSFHFDLRKICRTSYHDDIAEDLTQEDFFRYDVTGTGHVILSNFRPHVAITTHKANFLNGYCVLPPTSPAPSLEDLLASVVPGSVEDRALGAILGMVVGDALAAPFEYLSAEERSALLGGRKPVTELAELLPSPHYGLMPGQWTDVGSTGLCVLDTLLENPEFAPVDFQVRLFNWWYFGYNNSHGPASEGSRKKGIDGSSVGLDTVTHDALLFFMDWGFPSHAPDRHESDDETLWFEPEVPIAVARVAPIAVRYGLSQQHPQLGQALSIASRQALVTNFDSFRAVTLAQYVCALVTHALRNPSGSTSGSGSGSGSGKSKAQEVLQGFLQTSANDPTVAPILQRRTRAIDWTHPVALGTVMNGEQQLAAALHCVWSTSTFGEALTKVLEIPGEGTTTLGSLVGQLAGAIYGVSGMPTSWVAAVHAHDGGSIVARARRLLQISAATTTTTTDPEKEEAQAATIQFSRSSRISIAVSTFQL